MCVWVGPGAGVSTGMSVHDNRCMFVFGHRCGAPLRARAHVFAYHINVGFGSKGPLGLEE